MSPSATRSPRRHTDWMESLYERLAEDDEGRVCKAISEDACSEAPGNFMRHLLANTLSNVADRLASAKTTLPWLLMQLGAPAWMLSLLVLFSLSRGSCSVAYKDVQGKTIPKTRRGRLAGWISEVSGLTALVGAAMGLRWEAVSG